MGIGLPTTVIMFLGLVCAVLANIPSYTWIYGANWDWVNSVPMVMIGNGLSMMVTFFHEIGHTIFAWYYGYPTLPVFDFEHGGGLAVSVTGQQIVIVCMVWAAMAYGVWALNGTSRFLQVMIVLLFLFNIATAFTHYHQQVINFMGPGLEPLVACFFLYRAFYDLAPRGDLERFMNAFLGFAISFNIFIRAYALLYNDVFRNVYFNQKGAHGVGDFDKIADNTALDFNGVVVVWIALTMLCLIVPAIHYFKDRLSGDIVD